MTINMTGTVSCEETQLRDVLDSGMRTVAAEPPDEDASIDIGHLPESCAGEWDAFVHQHECGTLFHETGWSAAAAESFGHEPILLTARRAGRLVGALPLHAVLSPLTGRRLVSMPYGVGGGILAKDPLVARALIDAAETEARRRDCTRIELRSAAAGILTNDSEHDVESISGYVGFRRKLPESEAHVLKFLPRKARAAARQGKDKHNLDLHWGGQHLRTVWNLYARNMRRLGSLAYPLSFFEFLANRFSNRIWVALLTRGSQPVGGLVSFLFRGDVMPYFFGATPDARKWCAANYIYRCAMERAVREGFTHFDFGRSRIGNKGSFNFKKFHGFEPAPLEYQTIHLTPRRSRSLNPGSPRIALARKVWPVLPLAITNALGARLAKHLPG